MKTVSLADAKAGLGRYVRECEQGKPVVITRRGKAVAVLMSPQNEDDLERLVLSRSTRFQALLRKSERSIDAGKGLSSEEFWKAVAVQTRKKNSKA